MSITTLDDVRTHIGHVVAVVTTTDGRRVFFDVGEDETVAGLLARLLFHKSNPGLHGAIELRLTVPAP